METITRITTRTTVLAITKNEPPSLVTRTRAVNSQGIARHFTFMFPVLDPQLLQRLSAEVQKGDEIKASIVNIWREDGHSTYLEDFQQVEPVELETPPTRELAAQAA